MPRPFLELTVDQFSDLVQKFPWQRRITEVHLHHSWRPNHADFSARTAIQSMEAIYAHQTAQAGLSDLAQHVTIDPRGSIWTGRNWNDPPASANGFNGNSIAGPFMLQIIGNFDAGQDELRDQQLSTVIDVIAIVQKLWGLPPEAFRFHQEMGDKSCPGSSITKQSLLGAVNAAHPQWSVPKATVNGLGVPNGDATRNLLQLFNVTTASRAIADEGELPESDMTLHDVGVVTGRVAPATGPGIAADGDQHDLTPDELLFLRRHVVNLRMGALSAGGLFHSPPEDVEAIFTEHLPKFMETHPKLRLVFYAHGGLNEELEALKAARNRIPFYLENGCYPIFFVWETGPKETLIDILGDLIGVSTGRAVTDVITDMTDPALEAAFRHGGFTMWADMKLSAERAFLPRQGGTFFVEQLTKFWRDHSANMEMHAIGHSAGSIFHAHFLNLLCGQPANPPVEVKTLHFLAPAITVDLFADKLAPLIGGRIKSLTEFTMHKDFELADSVGPYRKSLLYLVSRSFEDSPETPILGLEESIRRDPDMIRFFGLLGKKPKAELVFSVQENGPRQSSIARKHGDFDNDRFTMAGVMRRILDVADDVKIVEFPEFIARNVLETAKPVSLIQAPTSTVPALAAPAGKGRKIALCVGIDEYPNPYRLGGCVNDAKAWAAALKALRFDTKLMLNGDATWEGLCKALKDLVSDTRSGDVLVVQFAGHGTRVKDLDNDERSGRDSALCPVDFTSGGFLIDDDVREIFEKLPAGVNLTCFFDCCHSGTITRFLAPTPQKPAGDVRVRGFRAEPEMEEAHERFRENRASRANIPARKSAAMREISFSACTDVQTAQEVDGHGQFTVRALKILAGGLNGLTNASFLSKVQAAFGDDLGEQTPGLDCAKAAKNQILLASLATAQPKHQTAKASNLQTAGRP